MASVLVLIAEDHPEIRGLLQADFEEGGFSVLLASSAEQAIAAITDQPEKIRALITDIRLGGPATGWDVARRAREENPGVAVVYTTGSEGGDWLSLGVPNSILIAKPFAVSQVLTAVAQLLNTGRAPGVPTPTST